MGTGTIIFLNGTSSAGKTTLAHALQDQLDEPYQHMALDQFRDGLPARYRGLNSPDGTPGQLGLNVVPVTGPNGRYTNVVFGESGKQMLKGMRRAIAAMATSGNNIIIDDILLEPDFLSDYLQALAGLRVYFVGVRCPIETINAREAKRPGRFPGTAVGHLVTCHAHGCYDVEVDTSSFTPAECASRVISRLRLGPPEAFGHLQSRLS